MDWDQNLVFPSQIHLSDKDTCGWARLWKSNSQWAAAFPQLQVGNPFKK